MGANEIDYRNATAADTSAIAQLHAESWQTTYRGALSDAFLGGDVLQNRRALWEKRLTTPSTNQQVLVAAIDNQTVGFGCLYGDDDSTWGSLLDNLHVRRDLQGRGIGAQLLRDLASYSRAHYPDRGLYLWVLDQNEGARQFYRHLGAIDVGGDIWDPPGGGAVPRRRYFWKHALIAETRSAG